MFVLVDLLTRANIGKIIFYLLKNILMSIAREHIEFILRTKKKITYYKYYGYRVYSNITDEEIEKINIEWGGDRYKDKKTIANQYREAVKK
jgi:hypothetical protein